MRTAGQSAARTQRLSAPGPQPTDGALPGCAACGRQRDLPSCGLQRSRLTTWPGGPVDHGSPEQKRRADIPDLHLRDLADVAVAIGVGPLLPVAAGHDPVTLPQLLCAVLSLQAPGVQVVELRVSVLPGVRFGVLNAGGEGHPQAADSPPRWRVAQFRVMGEVAVDVALTQGLPVAVGARLGLGSGRAGCVGSWSAHAPVPFCWPLALLPADVSVTALTAQPGWRPAWSAG